MLNTVQGRRRVYNLSFVRSSLVGLSWTKTILCVGSNPTSITSFNEIKLKVHPYNTKLTWSSEDT